MIIVRGKRGNSDFNLPPIKQVRGFANWFRNELKINKVVTVDSFLYRVRPYMGLGCRTNWYSSEIGVDYLDYVENSTEYGWRIEDFDLENDIKVLEQFSHNGVYFYNCMVIFKYPKLLVEKEKNNE